MGKLFQFFLFSLFLVVFFVICSSGFADQGGTSHVFRGSVSPRPGASSQTKSVEQVPAQTNTKAAAPSAKALQQKSASTKAAAPSTKAPQQKSASPKAAAPSTKASQQKSASTKAAAPSTKASQQKSASTKAAAPSTKASQQKSASTKAAAASTKTPPKSQAQEKKQGVKTKESAKPAVAAKKPAANQKQQDASSKPELQLNVRAAYLINMSTGKVYFEYNADQAMAPASLTKLLTLYLVNEALAKGTLSRETLIPISAQAVKTGGSRMSLAKGEKVPLGELIKGISVVSANNACVAVAEYMSQNQPAKFITRMNTKAKDLGMSKSVFKNSNGLPAEGQVSTARDIGKLATSYLRAFPESLKIHSQTTHTYHGTTHCNANSLLRTYKGVDGLKTGFVVASGYSIAATAKRGDTRLVAVLLGASNAIARQVEATKLLDYGFKKAAADKSLEAKAQGQKNKGT